MNDAYVTLHFLHPVRCIRNPRATVSTIPDTHCNSRSHFRQRHGALIFLFRSCIHSLRVPVNPTPLPSHREPRASRVARAHRFGNPGVCVYARPVVTPGRPRTPGVGCGEQDVRKTLRKPRSKAQGVRWAVGVTSRPVGGGETRSRGTVF